jgi:RNA 2',3'-cyclic 3'-phosphodiesterase
MRIFVAIPITGNAQEELSLLQNRLSISNLSVRWILPSNIHITLKFFGDINQEKISQISGALRQASKTCKRFEFEIAGIGAFPCISRPDIIWAGLKIGKADCIALEKNIQAHIENLFANKESRSYFPHLTIGRVIHSGKKKLLAYALEKEKNFSIKTKVAAKKIVLFSSLLTAKGPIYTSLEEFLLPAGC